MRPTSSPPRWQFWIDRGGTFTALVARRPDGSIATHTRLSDNPDHDRDAALAGRRHVLGMAPAGPIPGERIAAVHMGTTVATNALLERTGERTVRCITRGVGDALRIASQNRPKIFARQIVLPERLYRKVVEVGERVGARGARRSTASAPAALCMPPTMRATARSPACSCTATAPRRTSSRWRRWRAPSATARSRCRTR